MENHDPLTIDSNTEDEDQRVLNTIEVAQRTIAQELRIGSIKPDVMAKALEKALNNARQASQTQKERITYTVEELINEYWNQIEKRKATISTGIPGLDSVLSGGLETKRLKVILGAPGSGKTTFTNQISVHVANSGRPVLYVTSEDSPFTLLAKTIARIGNIHYTAVLKGWAEARDEINRTLREYATQMSAQRLRYLDATAGPTTLADICEVAQKHFEVYHNAEHGGSGVLVIDYLQRIARSQYQSDNMELRQMVSRFTNDLREVANALDCCVIALASQNRASGYGASNGSAIASAKESGDIEYTADVIMSIAEDKREEKKGQQQRTSIMTDKGMMRPWLLSLDKNRLGQQDAKIPLEWFPERQMFGEFGENM